MALWKAGFLPKREGCCGFGPGERPERDLGAVLATYTRVHRLLKVLTLVQSGRATSPAELAAECDVVERTIFRDLNELAAVGIPVHFDSDANRYRVADDFFLPPVQLTPQEALAIAVLCEQIAEKEQIPFTRAAWPGLAKIQAAMPQSVRDEIARVASSVIIQTAQSVPQEGFVRVYEQVQDAIVSRRALRCRYDSMNPGTDDQSEFDFEPYALFFSLRAWYAVGFHHARGEVRTLKLNRFHTITVTDRAYAVPEDFTLDAHLGNAWRMIRGDQDQEVVIRFDPAFAEGIAETLWHKTQKVDFAEDGSAVFRCTVSGLDEIAWWVLSMGPNCEVIEPAALRDRVRDAANAMAARYAPPVR